jgi:hypothetical protein
MSPDSIPQISLGTAVLVIFLMCAGFVMLRGITRVLVGAGVLAASAWVGFSVWQKAAAVSLEWFGKPLGVVTTGLPLVAFFAAFFLLRWFAHAVARPFGDQREEQAKAAGSLMKYSLALLLALVPTALICLIGATLIHHTGSIAEVRAYAEKTLGISDPTLAKFSQTLKSSVADALPESWLRVLDPLADPARLALAKLITARAESPLEPVRDPVTGKPIPRAILVDDPELQNLAREGKFGTLLRHPLLTKALEDPKVQALLKELQL